MKILVIKSIRIFLLAIIIGIFAQLEINLPDHLLGISITGQTFIILFLAYILSKPEAIASIICYLLIGLFGLPVFSSFSSGWETFSGPSLGYFIGFVLSTLYIVLIKRQKDNFVSILFHFLVATLIILFSGFIGLLTILSPSESYHSGVQPFILGGVIKAILAVFAVYFYRYLLTSLEKNHKS